MKRPIRFRSIRESSHLGTRSQPLCYQDPRYTLARGNIIRGDHPRTHKAVTMQRVSGVVTGGDNI